MAEYEKTIAQMIGKGHGQAGRVRQGAGCTAVPVQSPCPRCLFYITEDEQRTNMTSQKNLQQLTMEKDQALADLNSVERSLSDLFRRYENLKGVLEGFKKVLTLVSLSPHSPGAPCPGAALPPPCPMLQHRGSPSHAELLRMPQPLLRGLLTRFCSSACFLINEQRDFPMRGEAIAGAWFSGSSHSSHHSPTEHRALGRAVAKGRADAGQSTLQNPASIYAPFFRTVELNQELQHKGEAGSIQTHLLLPSEQGKRYHPIKAPSLYPVPVQMDVLFLSRMKKL